MTDLMVWQISMDSAKHFLNGAMSYELLKQGGAPRRACKHISKLLFIVINRSIEYDQFY